MIRGRLAGAGVALALAAAMGALGAPAAHADQTQCSQARSAQQDDYAGTAVALSGRSRNYEARVAGRISELTYRANDEAYLADLAEIRLRRAVRQMCNEQDQAQGKPTWDEPASGVREVSGEQIQWNWNSASRLDWMGLIGGGVVRSGIVTVGTPVPLPPRPDDDNEGVDTNVE